MTNDSSFVEELITRWLCHRGWSILTSPRGRRCTHAEHDSPTARNFFMLQPGSIQCEPVECRRLYIHITGRCLRRLNDKTPAAAKINSRTLINCRTLKQRTTNIVDGLSGIRIESNRSPNVP